MPTDGEAKAAMADCAAAEEGQAAATVKSAAAARLSVDRKFRAEYAERMQLDADSAWVAVGFLGQALFGARFVWQWVKSEKKKRVVVPMAFWYLSVAGGATLLAYAIHRRDPVFIAGQGLGLCIYLRNITFAWRERRDKAEGGLNV